MEYKVEIWENGDWKKVFENKYLGPSIDEGLRLFHKEEKDAVRLLNRLNNVVLYWGGV